MESQIAQESSSGGGGEEGGEGAGTSDTETDSGAGAGDAVDTGEGDLGGFDGGGFGDFLIIFARSEFSALQNLLYLRGESKGNGSLSSSIDPR
jgi:hypothetical protein